MNELTNIATGLARLGTFLRAENWKQAERSSLTPTQAQILVHLSRRGPARVGAVAEEIAVTQPTATDSVAALIRKGHVEKRPDPEDARAVRLHATRSGKRAAEKLAVWPDALLGAIDTLDDVERAVMLKALTKMIRKLQQENAVGLQRLCATCTHFRPHRHPGTAAPHHCALVDAAFGNGDLRLDCMDHSPAEPATLSRNWNRFSRSGET